MPGYALLIAPSSNRVYADASIRLTRSELEVFAGSVLDAKIEHVDETTLGGVPYLAFRTDRPLGARDLAYLSNLSSAYALFGVEGDLLRPIELCPLAVFDDDLLTIQKYPGKTNEQFTKLLLNVTLLACDRAGALLDRRLVVLDPLCGRGTTCNQALMYGYDAIGIDTDGKDFDLYAAFIRTWLRRKRIKHSAAVTPVRKDKRTVARRLAVEIGGGPALTVFHADSTQAREFLKAGVADVIVGDLPYGVAHGSRTGGELLRGPLNLLTAAVPVWTRLLRPGGALGLSWNTHVASRADAVDVLHRNGLRVCEGGPWESFGHWVDQSIDRDILVATKG